MSIDLNDQERRDLRRKTRLATLAALRSLGGEARREAIHERALADGGFTPRELGAPPPAAAANKHRRLVDHHLAWELTNLKRDGLVENPARSVWRLAGAALEAPAAAGDEPVAPDRLSTLQALPYRAYLRTPEWRRARAAALERAGYSCSMDVTHTEQLDVHHRTYERLGAELATDLTVLCRPCHQLHHAEHGRPKRSGGTRAASTHQRERRPSLLRRLFAG